MCFDDGPGPTKQMMDQFLNSCAALSYTTGQAVDTDCANMANVQRALTGEAPQCSDSKTFDGCATDCSYMTCARVLEERFEKRTYRFAFRDFIKNNSLCFFFKSC